MPLPQPNITPLRDAQIGFGLWPWSKGPLWRLEEDWEFEAAGRFFTIPKGYQFDKASVPSFFWGAPFNYTPDGLCTVPALQHDFLCDLLLGGSEWLKEQLGELPKPLSPFDTHHSFYLALLEYGVRPSKAKTMYVAVKNFGPKGRLRPSSWFAKKAG